MQFFTAISLLAITLAASVSDTREGIIPNRLCIAGLLLSVVTRLAECRGFQMEDIPGIIWVMILFLLAYRFQRIGGGDVKLLSVILFLLPFKSAVFFIWLTMLFAGIAGIIGYCAMRIRFLRLGPAFFLATLTIIYFGGSK